MRYRTLIMPLILAITGGAGMPAASAAPASTPQAGEVASLADLPSDIRVVIGPDVSDRGGPFAPGCVAAKGEPHSRFAGARMDADSAQVTIERGGIAHYFDTLDFRRVDGRWVHVPKQPGQGGPVTAPKE
ncbi:hypothetical protein AB595_23560 [Massilia sp. WF1]|uniref:hypothetical protein n=1 Tax=unclassified Massilia TaxID=2609279 RepID=UPI00068E0A2D|nr:MULTISPECIES: hypothetical protein [unclassified Massilia]ALK95852.1 hypothetical protein AM586_05705 [Massilia sp. WG5]KNZ67927.1 hypothetical protein AB595_23560 [Massilia sp. WF1]